MSRIYNAGDGFPVFNTLLDILENMPDFEKQCLADTAGNGLTRCGIDRFQEFVDLVKKKVYEDTDGWPMEPKIGKEVGVVWAKGEYGTGIVVSFDKDMVVLWMNYTVRSGQTGQMRSWKRKEVKLFDNLSQAVEASRQ